MKLAMVMMLGALLTGLGACESDATGPRAATPNPALENSPGNMHRDVARGDASLETAIGRYDLDRD
jgi:hypothetical protein